MSGTTSTQSTGTNPDSLWSPTFVVAVMLILLVAGTVYGVFHQSTAEVQSTIAGSIVSGIISGVTGYFFGASKHSPASGVAPSPGTVTTTTTPPTVTTISTEAVKPEGDTGSTGSTGATGATGATS